MHNSKRSVLLMMLPVFGLLAFALWRRPKSPPPIAIKADVLRDRLFPVDVGMGWDTKILIPYAPVGEFPAALKRDDLEWLWCFRLVARKNGRERTLFRKVDMDNPPDIRQLPAHEDWDEYWWSYAFALRNVPPEWGEIWAHLDLGLRTADRCAEWDIDAVTVARLKKQKGTVWFSKSLLLRRDGETIKLPVMSTDPQLELRDWHVEPCAPEDTNGHDRLLVMHLFNSGSLLDKRAPFAIPSCSNWDVVDEKGNTIISYFGAPTRGDLSKGRRHYKATFSFSSKMAPQARRLRVRGALSCHKRWPLKIDILLLDRTKQTSKARPRSK